MIKTATWFRIYRLDFIKNTEYMRWVGVETYLFEELRMAYEFVELICVTKSWIFKLPYAQLVRMTPLKRIQMIFDEQQASLNNRQISFHVNYTLVLKQIGVGFIH